MGGYFFPTQEDYDSYQGYDYSDPLGINKLKKPKEEEPNFLGSLMDWTNKYEYEGTHDIDPITGEVTKKSLPGILGGVVSDLFSAPKKGVDWLASRASGLDKTIPAEEILTNALFPKYDSAPIANNFLKPFIEAVPGGALITAHDNLSKLKENDYKPISDAAEVGESALRGVTRGAGSLLLDPTLWTGLNAPGALGTGIGAYFGVEGLSGAGEKLGESYSKAFDQGDTSGAIEPFIEALIFGGLGAKGIEHSGKSLPEVKFGDYSSRSKLNFESSPAPREIPNFASAMADGRTPSEPSFLEGVLDDPLLKRYDELKDLGVLVNPTGRVPKTETLYHGTGNEWGVDPNTGEFNPFSSRKASDNNLYGGPFYFTKSEPIAEGQFSVAGEGQGPNPEVINADVTTTKRFDLDAPIPNDVRVKGLTKLNELIRNAENKAQGESLRRYYDSFKNAKTGRQAQDILGDVLEFTDKSSEDLRLDPHKTTPYPLRDRKLQQGKDLFNRLIEDELGYDSLTHYSQSQGSQVTVPFSRHQIKTRGAQKLKPLSERSTEGLISEYKTLDPNKESNEPLREALKDELSTRYNKAGFIGSGDKWSSEYYEKFKQYLESQLDTIPEFDRNDSNTRYVNLKDQYDSLISFDSAERKLLADFKESKPGTRFERVEPELTPEDQALLSNKEQIPLSENELGQIYEEPKDIPVGEWVDKAARALGFQDLPTSTSNIQGESLSQSAKFIQSQKRKYGKDWETKQTQSEGDYLRKLLSKELAGEKVSEKEPTVISTNEPKFEEVDPDIAELRDSISQKSPYEMVGKEHPERSSLDRAIEQVVAKRPPKTPKTEEVDIEGEPLKKQNFQVSLSNGEVYTVKATDEIGAREQVQDLIDKHGSKFNITDVKPKYSKLESDLITSANPTEERLATRTGKEVAGEETRAKTWEESQRQKAQLQELKDQLKVEKQKAQAGDKEAKLREKAIEQEIKDKLRVEEQFKKAEAKKRQQEFQAKINAKEPSGVSQFLGSVKALASSGDLGHIARQGKQGTLYLLTHSPKEVGTAFKRMAKQTFSEKEFKAFHETLAQDPKLVRMSKDFNLDMPGLPGHLGEEAFHGGEAIESIKGLGSYVRGSDRAYTSYMNSLRYSLVNDGIRRLEKSGFTMDKNPEKYRQLARGINIITQRGDISGKAAQLFNTASNVFWAPRAKYSRIQQIGELVKPGESGRLARQGLAHTMAFNALLFGLLKAKYGDDVKFNTDPTNTDYLKIRIKNTTVDPWFGLGTIIRSANQGLKGEKTSGSTGKTVPVSASDAVGTFLTSSLAPGITMLYELASGKSTLGFEKSRLESLLGVAPLAMRDIRDITEEHGLDGLLLDILSYEGEQVNTFNPQKAKAEQERLKKERGLKVKPKSSKGTGVNYKELYNF